MQAVAVSLRAAAADDRPARPDADAPANVAPPFQTAVDLLRSNLHTRLAHRNTEAYMCQIGLANRSIFFSVSGALQ